MEWNRFQQADSQGSGHLKVGKGSNASASLRRWSRLYQLLPRIVCGSSLAQNHLLSFTPVAVRRFSHSTLYQTKGSSYMTSALCSGETLMELVSPFWLSLSKA